MNIQEVKTIATESIVLEASSSYPTVNNKNQPGKSDSNYSVIRHAELRLSRAQFEKNNSSKKRGFEDSIKP